MSLSQSEITKNMILVLTMIMAMAIAMTFTYGQCHEILEKLFFCIIWVIYQSQWYEYETSIAIISMFL